MKLTARELTAKLGNVKIGNAAPQGVVGKKYNVDVLKEMMKIETRNIMSFQREIMAKAESGADSSDAEERLAQFVATRRFLAALIENDGLLDENFKSFENGWVGLDRMAYDAYNGADTSHWTKGT